MVIKQILINSMELEQQHPSPSSINNNIRGPNKRVLLRNNNNSPTLIVEELESNNNHDNEGDAAQLEDNSGGGIVEMMVVPTTTSYTSLRDIMMMMPAQYPMNINASWNEIPMNIKNPLLKHAALAYLQPMSSSTTPSDAAASSNKLRFLHTFMEKCQFGCATLLGAFLAFFCHSHRNRRRRNFNHDEDDHDHADDDEDNVD